MAAVLAESAPNADPRQPVDRMRTSDPRVFAVGEWPPAGAKRRLPTPCTR